MQAFFFSEAFSVALYMTMFLNVSYGVNACMHTSIDEFQHKVSNYDHLYNE